MGLSDDPDLPARYVFPAGSSIAANGYLVIDSNTLGFGLGSEGDSIGLFTSGGTAIDSVEFGLQVSDLSISRTGLGANTWALTTPTLGTANASPQALGSPDSLRINEWLVRPQITFDEDFVELYNPVALPVALGGLVITDEPVAYPQRHSLAPLSFVAPAGSPCFFRSGATASRLAMLASCRSSCRRTTAGYRSRERMASRSTRCTTSASATTSPSGARRTGLPRSSTSTFLLPGFSNSHGPERGSGSPREPAHHRDHVPPGR